MEWNGKWDWENLVSFGSKPTYGPKKLHLGDLFIEDGEIDAPSPFNLSSGSDGRHASAESSTRDEIQNPMSSLTNMVTKEAEPLIGLKLGKRTYFETTGAVANAKPSSSSARPTTSNRTAKSSYRTRPIPRCSVEGCTADLSTAKEYHRKHKVCEAHSKSSRVIVGGVERRFCQQCSRFHNLSEFDEKKRSCRRRLFDHNARRRKPQQEGILFNPAGHSSPSYGGREQTGFFLTNGSHLQTRGYATPKFNITRDPSMGNGVIVHSGAGFFATKNSTPDFLGSGAKESFINSPHMEAAAAEYGRALSLLSTNSWSSCGPESSSLPPVHYQNATEPVMYALSEEGCLPEFLIPGNHSATQTRDSPQIHEPAVFYPSGHHLTDKTSSQFGFY